MAGNLALESFPVTQEPHRNRDSKSSAAHCFCHAKYTHVSQTLWRGLGRGLHILGRRAGASRPRDTGAGGDSLNALRDQRRRESTEAANFAEISARAAQTENLYANTGEALRHAMERVEARTAEATELRIRLEITEKAESTLREELAEERRRRERAERELDELRHRLADVEQPTPHEPPSEAREYAVRPRPQPGRVGSQAAVEGSQEPSQGTQTPAAVSEEEANPRPSTGSTGESAERRPWWRRMFGG
jgi:hypothetical protein